MSEEPTIAGMGAGSSPTAEPTQEELLELIREGADNWNAWRDRHPKIKIDLSGTLFVQLGIKNFSKFKFGDVNFSKCYFDHETDFTGATFGRANFSKAIFGNEVTFESTKFQSADFKGVTFFRLTNFHRAEFGIANFSEAKSQWNINFSRTKFKRADFSGMEFGAVVTFEKAEFSGRSHFDNAVFGEKMAIEQPDNNYTNINYTYFDEISKNEGSGWTLSVDFRDASFSDWLHFRNTVFLGNVSFRGSKKRDGIGELVPDASSEFHSVDFSYARFHGEADFSGRKLLGRTMFTYARFEQLPNFEFISGIEYIDWTGAKFSFSGYCDTLPRVFWYLGIGTSKVGRIRSAAPHVRKTTFYLKEKFYFRTPEWTTAANTLYNLRVLKKIATSIYDNDAERNIFILERKAQRGILWHDWQSNGGFIPWLQAVHATVLMFFFSLLSDCGRSIGRPALGLAASTLGFWLAYDSLATDGDNLRIGESDRYTTRTSALLAFTASRFLPLIGTLRGAAQDAEVALFTRIDRALPLESVQLLSTLQGLINAVLIFLLLLAIRNHFRVG